tara:strand:- start:7548 stop:8843 length:1296 start_codon:yes stop_codon:yes gene_type:complete
MDVIENGLPGLLGDGEEVDQSKPNIGENLGPLAHRMRPRKLEDFEGSTNLIAKYPILKGNPLHSLILWGPPGCGKTTLAEVLALEKEIPFFKFNAVLGGLAELRKVIEKGKKASLEGNSPWILFIDEIHRFNKAQQDALLPFVETGSFILVGATTESPYTAINKALLSRVQTIKLPKLSEDSILSLLEKALKKEGRKASQKILQAFSHLCDGDSRKALSYLENAFHSPIINKESPTKKEIQTLTLGAHRTFDRDGDRHYDVISAFIKSMRGSDPHSATLWLAVMIEGGEDPQFIARRLVIFASEDIGNADPRALTLATSCLQAVQSIGMPESRIILSQTTNYLASTVKSNASYKAINDAIEFVKERPTIEVPPHLKNKGPQKKEYKYPHNYPEGHIPQEYSSHNTPLFYKPFPRGQEAFLLERLKKLGLLK